jgi:hypothetical protein
LEIKRRTLIRKQGRRADLDNLYFRSSWEANIARYLNFLKKHNQIFDWKFESKEFWFDDIKRGTRSYKCDFEVFEKKDSEPIYYEVKGYMDSVSKTKLKRMKKYHPNVKITVIGKSAYYEIKKKVSALIPGWE